MARLGSASLVLIFLALLGGCARKPVEIAVVPVPVAPLPLRASLPPGASPNQAIPPIAADGRYLTPNHGLTPTETLWHVRAALNVAALGCRGSGEAATVARYNALLTTYKSALAATDTAVKAAYRTRHGDAWQAAHDTQMTRVYNFFAQVPVQQRFCATAAGLLAEVATLPPAELQAFAVAALPQLEEPFTDFYRAFDRYRAAQAQVPPPAPGPQLPYEVAVLQR